MTDIVIDASIALAWCFRDEMNEAVAEVRDRLQSDSATVPVLWPLEVANVLWSAERRNRITTAESAQLIALLGTLDIRIDDAAISLAFTRVLDLAREEQLTAYDAAYLELAMRLGLPLASKDRKLCDAAERVGVAVIRAD